MGLNIKKTDRILVVAPHPDDESIGCGGLLAMYGAQCDVLLITDGKSENQSESIALLREKEFVDAVSFAGINNYICLRIPEQQIVENSGKIKQINFKKYTHIFVPNRDDEHNDHVATYKVVRRVAGAKASLYEYEVWQTLRRPNIYLDITSVVEQKAEMIRMHQSQINKLDYVSMILGLNSYRGIGHQMKFAECFYCEREHRSSRVRKFKRIIKKYIKRCL